MEEITIFIEKFKKELDINDTIVTPYTIFQEEEYWDSLNGIAVFLMIEEEYGVEVTNEDIEALTTVEDLYNLIKSKQ